MTRRALKCPDCGTLGARLMNNTPTRIGKKSYYNVECIDDSSRCNRAWLTSHAGVRAFVAQWKPKGRVFIVLAPEGFPDE